MTGNTSRQVRASAQFYTWALFSPLLDPERDFEQLTSTGPFSGVLGAFTTGVRLRTRYQHLLPSGGKPNFWAGDSPRVIDTARYFAAGFFGLDWENHSTLHIIPETAELGADTLTPGDTCYAYIEDLEYGHDYGARMLAQYRATYLSEIRKRLLKQNPDIEFTDTELYSMQEMCGFETTVRGSSAWCDVFSKDEWLSFEYARDVIHFYRAGPGNRFGALMGWLWLNATTNLLVEGPSAGPLFFSLYVVRAPMSDCADVCSQRSRRRHCADARCIGYFSRRRGFADNASSRWPCLEDLSDHPNGWSHHIRKAVMSFRKRVFDEDLCAHQCQRRNRAGARLQ